MAPFAKRMFIPLMVALALLALYLFLFYERPRMQDVRDAVPVEKFSLSNGMQVVVMPNRRTEAVTHILVVKAGAADDPYGKTGLAHYLEHAMFTGSKNYPEGMYDQNIRNVGGELNAYTTKDYTAYYATVATPHLPMVMAMEADRLQHPNFSPEKLARELKVITEERHQRVETEPEALLDEQLVALAYLNHPYHHPTIGWAEDMATLTPADVADYFTRHYRASNLILIVSGEVDAAEVRRQAQRYYGSLPAGEPPARVWPKEPPARLARRATMEDATVKEPRLIRHYTAPSFGDGATEQALPLALFAEYLGSGDAAFLTQRLVREAKLASAVNVDYTPFTMGPQLFTIRATPVSGVTLAALESALDAALAEALTAPPNAEAVARVKTRLKAEVIFAQDGLFALANVMAGLFARGQDEEQFYQWATTVEAVTAEQILAAAKATLIPKRSVTGHLTPPAATEAAHE